MGSGLGASAIAEAMFRNTVNFTAVVDAERKAAFKALWMHGQAVVTQAQKDKLVPIETGTLRRSSVVTLAYLPKPEDVYQLALSGGNLSMTPLIRSCKTKLHL
jgi:hypothetical protein